MVKYFDFLDTFFGYMVFIDNLTDETPLMSSENVINDDRINGNKSELYNDASFNDTKTCAKLGLIYSNKTFKKFLPFIIFWVCTGYIPAVFFAAWGAEWFAGCKSNKNVNTECEFAYNEYNKYAQLFASLGGLMAFLFSGVIGRISDTFGRKPIFYVNIILSSLMYTPLIFFKNIWIKFGFNVLAGINTSDNSFSPIMLAYISGPSYILFRIVCAPILSIL